jgi:hypothetical protein
MIKSFPLGRLHLRHSSSSRLLKSDQQMFARVEVSTGKGSRNSLKWQVAIRIRVNSNPFAAAAARGEEIKRKHPRAPSTRPTLHLALDSAETSRPGSPLPSRR